MYNSTITFITIGMDENANLLTNVELSAGATLPKKVPAEAAAFDLEIPETAILQPKSVTPQNTGVKLQLLKGTCALIIGRSGFKIKYPTLNIVLGLIDYGYTNEIFITIVNEGNEIVEIPAKSRIAQLLILTTPDIQLFEIPKLPVIQVSHHSGKGSTGGL